jgi:type VI secretion system protein ImpC
MADPTKAAAQAVTTDAELTLLDQIVEQGKMGKDADSKSKGKDLLKRFVGEVLEGAITFNRDTETMINARIAQIDHLLSLQLNEILHHPEFQKLEGSWRGLQYLLKQSETGAGLKIKVLNVSKKDLLRDLQRAPEFDQSALFKKIYEEEYGVFGGTPFGAMVGDYYFDKSGQDIELLEKISNVAAAAHAPFISATDPSMLNLESWTDLDQPRDLAKIFDSTEYAKWKGFRASEDSRYVALTAPRVLAREPYGSATVPVETFGYEERVDGTNHGHYTWMNAAYAMAANVNKAFAMYGWCASIRGVESGGLVEQLPVHNFRTESGEIAMKCPTEVQITDRREKELADLGFAPLVHQKGTANAAFFSVQSAQKPKVYDDPNASSSSRMSAQLPYIFATSRFAHYLKVMMRD